MFRDLRYSFRPSSSWIETLLRRSSTNIHFHFGKTQFSSVNIDSGKFYYYFPTFFCCVSFLFSYHSIFNVFHLFFFVPSIFRWNPDGEIISLPTFGSSRRSVLTCGMISSDWPRDITRIEGNFKTADYLQILERASDGNYGRNVAHLPTPVHTSRAVDEWFAAGPFNCLPWQVLIFFRSPPSGRDFFWSCE